MPDATFADTLNRSCHCISVDHVALEQSLASRLGEANAYVRLRQTHPHLLADSPVFISHEHILQMKSVVQAIEDVAALAAYRGRVLEWAPAIARSENGPHGVFFGYDFHLTGDGPRLIEVNTNAGGALLLLHLARAQQACCAAVERFIVGPVGLEDIEQKFVDMFRLELEAQAPHAELQRVAIVDEHPQDQYLSPEFLLFRQMFANAGIDAIVAGPEECELSSGRLITGGKRVDLVYNRLTDFYLQSEACALLKKAYASGAAVFTPGPRMHALFANKRNLTLLSNDALLREIGAADETRATLRMAIPWTELVTRRNADDLWKRRRQLFFKPACGYGSRGTYSGARLTRKKWAAILDAEYIAQELVPPSERSLVVSGEQASMKLDVRCYVYRGEIQLLGARLYRGQTTNFRTDGGGLAAVFTTPGE